MIVTLDKDYTFLTAYQNDAEYRIAFNNLVRKIFGLSFEEWYSAGYWNERYIPYTLFDKKKAVANVSVNIMDFNSFGKQQRYIQIGTVLTDKDYRNKKLSRFLMEKVLEEWKGKCDFIYLFANNSVLDMYPKFGFSTVKEYAYSKKLVNNNMSDRKFEKLNMDTQKNRAMLYYYAKNSEIFGNFSMKENADLVMFYCTSFLKENVYYIKALDVIAVAIMNENQLHLYDVFGTKKVKLDNIIDSLANFEINEVTLGFTPKDCSSYEAKEILGDETLFVQKNKIDLFEQNKIMFPLLSHA